MYYLFYSDGGLIHRGPKKIAYGTLLQVSSEVEFTHNEVLTYAKEYILPESVEIQKPWNFCEWKSRKLLSTPYGVELFNIFKTLYYIKMNKLLNDTNDIFIHVDNKVIYKHLLGYKSASNPYLTRLIASLHKLIISINESSKKKHMHFVLVSGDEMKLIVGH